MKNKLEDILNSSIGTDFKPNRIIFKKELAVLVDKLIRPFETKTIGFVENYKEQQVKFTNTLQLN